MVIFRHLKKLVHFLFQGWSTPRLVQEVRPVSRVDYLEDRLLAQDKTIQALLDRAYKIKEDIIDALNITHGTWQEERHSRELLQEHIRTITSVVGRLSRDIAVSIQFEFKSHVFVNPQAYCFVM